MDEAFYRRQRELLTDVLREQDVVITTAAVPGLKAPMLITAEMVSAMAPGSVIVDIAAERGGNCELTRPGRNIRAQRRHDYGPCESPVCPAARREPVVRVECLCIPETASCRTESSRSTVTIRSFGKHSSRMTGRS